MNKERMQKFIEELDKRGIAYEIKKVNDETTISIPSKEICFNAKNGDFFNNLLGEKQCIE